MVFCSVARWSEVSLPAWQAACSGTFAEMTVPAGFETDAVGGAVGGEPVHRAPGSRHGGFERRVISAKGAAPPSCPPPATPT